MNLEYKTVKGSLNEDVEKGHNTSLEIERICIIVTECVQI